MVNININIVTSWHEEPNTIVLEHVCDGSCTISQLCILESILSTSSLLYIKVKVFDSSYLLFLCLIVQNLEFINSQSLSVVMVQ